MGEQPSSPLAGLTVLLSGHDSRLVTALTAALVSIGWAAVAGATGSPGRSTGGVVAASVRGLAPEHTIVRVVLARAAGPLLATGSTVPVSRLHRRTVVVGPRSAAGALALAMVQGAAAVIDSEQPFLDLLTQLDAALRQPAPTDRAATLAALREQSRRGVALDRLTPREEVVLAALVEGRTAAEIARSAHVSIATVRTQIRDILGKLEVASQVAAVAAAHRHATGGMVREAVRRIHQF